MCMLCHAGAYYGAEAHLVTKLMINGQRRLVVFGEKHAPNGLPHAAICLMIIRAHRILTAKQSERHNCHTASIVED